MKFKGNGLIWDKENNRPLAQFKNGVFETENERTIEILTQKGFGQILDTAPDSEVSETKEPIEKEREGLPKKFQELRKLAKDLGIPDYMLKTKPQLESEILALKSQSGPEDNNPEGPIE